MTHTTTDNAIISVDGPRWPSAFAIALLAGAFIFCALPTSEVPIQDDAAAASAQIKNFKTAVLSYKLKFKQLPQNLDQLIDNPARSFLDARAIPNDPWGNPYTYEVTGDNFRIASWGADGNLGGDGEDADIWSDTL